MSEHAFYYRTAFIDKDATGWFAQHVGLDGSLGPHWFFAGPGIVFPTVEQIDGAVKEARRLLLFRVNRAYRYKIPHIRSTNTATTTTTKGFLFKKIHKG
jgi:hypothetical protein